MRSWPTSSAPSPITFSFYLTLERHSPACVHLYRPRSLRPPCLSSCGSPFPGHPSPQPCLANSYSSCKGDLDLCFGNDPGPSPLLLLLPTPSCAPSSSTAPCIYILVTLSSGFCSGLSNTLSGVTGFTSMRPERHVATRCWYQLHRAERCTGSSSMNELGSSRGIPVVQW